MLYMVIETFRDGDPVPVYKRFRDRGRLMPDGIVYRGSWVTEDLRRCYQVMECDDRRLLDVPHRDAVHHARLVEQPVDQLALRECHRSGA